MPLLSPSNINSKPAAPAPERTSKRTLLIVDDEEGPRQSLRIVFKEDYNILLADNGAKAIELARIHRIDAAVLDIRKGDMSGIDLLQCLKRIDPTIEVIMLTAFETIETARQALRLGACDYLNKPFDISTVREAVANAMLRRAMSDQILANNQMLKELQGEIKDRELREKVSRTRGEIYASILHDINSPLTVISGFIDLINHRLGETAYVAGEDLEIIKDRLSRITRQVTSCIQISRRYLTFLKNRPADPSRVSVNQTLSDLGELLKFHPSIGNHELIIEPSPEDAQVEMNGTDLIQILLNLTINALQSSTSSHRVEIHTRTLNGPVDLAAIADGPNERVVNRDGFQNVGPLVAISVRDNGSGIAPSVIQKIFEPYFTTKSDEHGTGLGLAIVNRLVKEAKGAIHVHTQSGNGTTFTMYLPVAR